MIIMIMIISGGIELINSFNFSWRYTRSLTTIPYLICSQSLTKHFNKTKNWIQCFFSPYIGMLQKTLSKLPRSVHNVFVTLQSEVKKFLKQNFVVTHFRPTFPCHTLVFCFHGAQKRNLGLKKWLPGLTRKIMTQAQIHEIAIEYGKPIMDFSLL